MSAPWTITARAAAGSPSTATQPAPNTPMQNRLRALQCTLTGVGAGTDQLVVRDGATGVGAILAQWDLSVAANGNSDQMVLSGLDIRSSLGNALTVEFVAGLANDREGINAQGDIVPVGTPYGFQAS